MDVHIHITKTKYIQQLAKIPKPCIYITTTSPKPYTISIISPLTKVKGHNMLPQNPYPHQSLLSQTIYMKDKMTRCSQKPTSLNAACMLPVWGVMGRQLR